MVALPKNVPPRACAALVVRIADGARECHRTRTLHTPRLRVHDDVVAVAGHVTLERAAEWMTTLQLLLLRLLMVDVVVRQRWSSRGQDSGSSTSSL